MLVEGNCISKIYKIKLIPNSIKLVTKTIPKLILCHLYIQNILQLRFAINAIAANVDVNLLIVNLLRRILICLRYLLVALSFFVNFFAITSSCIFLIKPANDVYLFPKSSLKILETMPR